MTIAFSHNVPGRASLNIAVISHSFHRIVEPYAGGLEMHTHLLCRQLSQLGHRVTLFAMEGTPATNEYSVESSTPANFAYRPYPAYSLPWHRQQSVLTQCFENVMRKIDIGDFDAVINNSLDAVPLAWATRIPVLTVLHTPILPGLHRSVIAAAEQPGKSFASVSAANAMTWRPYAPVVNVVHNGISVDGWQSRAASTDALRWAGRITAEKGLHDAIHAARLAGRELDISGPVYDRDYFGARIAPLLGTDVRYVGHLSHAELPDFYASGAVTIVSPHWEEPFGLVAVESLASGTPVAAYPRGAMSELIPGAVGALATDCTPTRLAKAIAQAAGKSRSACRSYATETFDAGVMVNGYLSILQSVRAGLEPLKTA